MRDNVVPFRGPTKGRMRRWRWSPTVVVPVLLICAGAGGMVYLLSQSKWPVDVTLRHWLASANCSSARLAGLAPPRPGEPGYYPEHDADQDGIACEPWPDGHLMRCIDTI